MNLLTAASLCALSLAAPPRAKGKPDKVVPVVAPLSVGKSEVTQQDVDLATQDEAQQVARKYLAALTGEGDDKGRDALLGGATLNARLEVLSNAKIVAREPYQTEKGELADVVANVDALDKEGRAALSKMMGGGPASDDPEGLDVQVMDGAQAQQLLAPTRARAAAFLKSHPVFAYVARVDREVYWHPKNPVRKLLVDAGGKGRYQLDFHLFKVETVEGKKARTWPLRVLRLRTDTLDTGWRILPASDWNAE
jgi:hypothetical protein